MQKELGLRCPALGRGGSKQALVSTKRVSEGLRILQDSAAPHFTPSPPGQPPYPECELQEWKTGAGGGHHWGGWGSQGKGQDPEALVTETRSEPVRLLFSTSNTRSVGLPPHPTPLWNPKVQNSSLYLPLGVGKGSPCRTFFHVSFSKTIY